MQSRRARPWGACVCDREYGGSYLVVIVDEHEWPEAASGTLARVVARATTRPCAQRVAGTHLEYVHRRGDRLRWLNTASSGTGLVGEAAHLLIDGSRPADGARLADKLASAEDSAEGLQAALSAFQEWRSDVQKVFAETENKPEDRALLVSTLFLNNKDALTIQDGSRMLLDEPRETSVRLLQVQVIALTQCARPGQQREPATLGTAFPSAVEPAHLCLAPPIQTAPHRLLNVPPAVRQALRRRTVLVSGYPPGCCSRAGPVRQTAGASRSGSAVGRSWRS